MVLLDKRLEPLWVTARLPQVGNLTLDNDALTRRKRQTAGETVHLTETALDAFVGLEDTLNSLAGTIVAVRRASPWRGRLQAAHLEFGQGLEVLDETLGVVVEDDAGVEQIVRVKNLLQFTHGGKSLLAPLILDKGRHITARAVLGLQRAVIFLNHQARHITHHGGIALHLTLITEELVDDEMIITFKGMAIDTGVLVAVIGDETLQFDGRLGQVLNGKGNVLDEARGAHGTRTAYTGEDARAYRPIFAIDGRVGSKSDGNIGLEL